MQTSEQHFDEIAQQYDAWKAKNWYYYSNLISLYQSHIPMDASVLEIGCGTGDILARLKISFGKGIDVSKEMIEIAKKKHALKPHLSFEAYNIYDSKEFFTEKYIFLADVLEHVEDLPRFIETLSARTQPGTKIIMSVANPLWEPVLMLAEKLGMKMPEGPHWRLGIKTNEKIFKDKGFILKERGYRLLVPKKVPGSDAINKVFYKNPFLARLGFVVFWVVEK